MLKNALDFEHSAKKNPTRRECLLAEFDNVIVWNDLHQFVEPAYAEIDGNARPTDWCGSLAARVDSFFISAPAY